MLNGIKNFLELVDQNWTTIVVIIGLCIGIAKKVQDFINKTDEEKIAIAKKQISQTILKMVSEAEEDYGFVSAAGKVKRSQVIAEIYKQYPILAKVVDQEQLIEWIDAEIDKSLDTVRDVITKNE